MCVWSKYDRGNAYLITYAAHTTAKIYYQRGGGECVHQDHFTHCKPIYVTANKQFVLRLNTIAARVAVFVADGEKRRRHRLY